MKFTDIDIHTADHQAIFERFALAYNWDHMICRFSFYNAIEQSYYCEYPHINYKVMNMWLDVWIELGFVKYKYSGHRMFNWLVWLEV
jgi:hypothetical protein